MGALLPLGRQTPGGHIPTRDPDSDPSVGRAGIFRNTDGAQGGIVSSHINAPGVGRNHMVKIRADPAGVVGEIKTQSSLGEIGENH